jgi:hypothetical protein
MPDLPPGLVPQPAKSQTHALIASVQEKLASMAADNTPPAFVFLFEAEKGTGMEAAADLMFIHKAVGSLVCELEQQMTEAAAPPALLKNVALAKALLGVTGNLTDDPAEPRRG